MATGRGKYVGPSTKLSAFNCPHCHVLTTQHWYRAHAEPLKANVTPLVFDSEEAQKRAGQLVKIEDKDDRDRATMRFQYIAIGLPFFERYSATVDYYLWNVSISECYECHKLAVWLHDRLAWPQQTTAPLPHPDLPAAIVKDYEEAANILDASARGAAALLRLVIERLCVHLGETTGRLDDKIAALVRKGLDPRAKMALDLVRVIGNNAVHPGQIDIRDDRPTAEKLFGLVNLIVDLTITQPKHLEEMFGNLPDGIKKAIERRDDRK
jgi:Domain of unknown function (DUF4145)